MYHKSWVCKVCEVCRDVISHWKKRVRKKKKENIFSVWENSPWESWHQPIHMLRFFAGLKWYLVPDGWCDFFLHGSRTIGTFVWICLEVTICYFRCYLRWLECVYAVVNVQILTDTQHQLINGKIWNSSSTQYTLNRIIATQVQQLSDLTWESKKHEEFLSTGYTFIRFCSYTLQGTNISHLWKRKIIDSNLSFQRIC